MSVSLHLGLPGSGKSLDVARIMLRYMFFGRRIIGNFPINPPRRYREIGKMPVTLENGDLTPVYLWKHAKRFHTPGKEHQTLVVIDECQLMFDRVDKQDKLRNLWVKFLTHHRKYGFDFIFVTQHDTLIDRRILCFVEEEVRHRKLTNYSGGSFTIMLMCTLLRLVGAKVFLAATRWYKCKEKPERRIFIYRKKYSRIYDSFKDFGFNFDEEIRRAEAAIARERKQAAGEPAPAGWVPPPVAGTSNEPLEDFTEQVLSGVFTEWGFKLGAGDAQREDKTG